MLKSGLKKIGGNDMDNNTPVYDFDDAVNYIAERCNVDIGKIEEVLTLEYDYMCSIGIISDEEPDMK